MAEQSALTRKVVGSTPIGRTNLSPIETLARRPDCLSGKADSISAWGANLGRGLNRWMYAGA
jgi:hypothetical protein